MIASREDLTRVEVEAWHRTHYRLDWLLYRTIGYALLSSTLAIYVFWAEAGRGEHPAAALWLSLTWILLLALGMLWYDFHTRVSYETGAEVRRRLSRHLAVSCLSFAGAVLFANAIHGVSVLIDKANQPAPSVFSAPGKGPEAPARSVHWRKGGPRDPSVKAKASNTTKAPAAKATSTKPAATKPAAKTGTMTVKKSTQPKVAAKKATLPKMPPKSQRKHSKSWYRRHGFI